MFNFAGPVTVAVNSSLGATLAVTVTDASGNLLAGIPVSFTAGSDPVTLASLAYTPVAGNFTTAPGGVGTAVATSNTKSGTYTVAATVPGANNTTITCQKAPTVTNLAGPISQIIIGTPAAPITAANGFTDSAVLGQFFTKPIPFYVADQYGNVVNQQVTVTFAAPPSNGGSTNPTASSTGGSLPVTTGTNGQGTLAPAAGAGFKAVNAIGSYNITATYAPIGGSAVTNGTVIQYTNLAAPALSCLFTPNTAITGVTTGGTFAANAFQVTVTDGLNGAGNPISGATITYSATNNGGATATGFSTPITVANGTASPTGETASNTAGTFAVSATATTTGLNGTTLQCGSIQVTTTGTGGSGLHLVLLSPIGTLVGISPDGTSLTVQLQDGNGVGVSPSTTVTGTISVGLNNSTGVFGDSTRSQIQRTYTASRGTGLATFQVFGGTGTSPYTITFTATGAAPLVVNLQNVRSN